MSSSPTSFASYAGTITRAPFPAGYRTCTLSWRQDSSVFYRLSARNSNAAAGLNCTRQKKTSSRKHKILAALASALPAVTRSILLPIDFYRVLGADTHFLADAVIRSYESRVNNLPVEGLSQDAIVARQEILRGACDTLANPELRAEYNDGLSEDEDGTIMVDVPFSKVPGALCLLQEAGEMEIVLQVGQNLLRERLTKAYHRDVVLAMGLAYVELSREAMAESPPEIMRSCELLERSLKLLQEEGGSSLAPALQQQISETLQLMNPRFVLELLSLPLGKKHNVRREEGKQELQSILWSVGEGGSYAPIPDFSREGFLKEAFSRLTAAEQVALFTATPSNIPAESSEVYTVALAHIAEAFVGKKPHLVREADTLFLELQQANTSLSDLPGDFCLADQRLDFAFERGMCALLLGEIDDCRAWLGLDDANSPYRDKSISDFVVANSYEIEGDYLPGLCKLLESWLGEVIFPSFREMLEMKVNLRDYFDDPSVLCSLEKLEKGGSPLAAAAAIVQLGAGASAALGSVKASALESLLKVFPIGRGRNNSKAEDDTVLASKARREFLSNALLTEGLQDNTAAPDEISIKTTGSLPGRAHDGEKLEGSVQVSPVKIIGTSVLIGALAFGCWRIFFSGKGLLKSLHDYPTARKMASFSGSTISTLGQNTIPYIDARVAESLVRRWQRVKSQALGRDHAVENLSEVLDGQMLQSWSERAKDVQKNGWYWEYKLTNLNVDSVTFSTDGRQAMVEVTLWEGASLYDERKSEVSDSYQSSYTTRYELTVINSGWKITSGTVLRS